MGYAKYKEDIERIHSQNIFGTFLDRIGEPVPHHCCPFCAFETHSKESVEAHILKEHRDAAIFLEHDDRIVPDRAVFRVRPVHLKVRCPFLLDGIDVTISSSTRSVPLRRYRDGDLLSITPPDEEVVIVTLRVGVFRREYGISFRRQVLNARLTPALLARVNAANSKISKWEWPDVGAFKAELLNEPGLSRDEAAHRHGLFEYFHALWLEQNHKPESRQHFEEAFHLLRDFHDPLSQLVTAYFLYRTNCFASVSPLIPFATLRLVAEFFGRDYDSATGTPKDAKANSGGEFVPFEIAIADADEAVFEAVSATLAKDLDRAMKHCAIAEERTAPIDDQARYRLLFLRYRIHRLAGNADEIRRLAKLLAVCNVASFRAEAEGFLRTN